MTPRFFYLANCDTCKDIMQFIQLPEDFPRQDIKSEAIRPEQLDHMISLAGSAEALFSRNAMKYRSMKLNQRTLSEADYRELILSEYTFLRRPVMVYGDKIFVGNAPAVRTATKAFLDEVLAR